MISGSRCRHLKIAGRFNIEVSSPYQPDRLIAATSHFRLNNGVIIKANPIVPHRVVMIVRRFKGGLTSRVAELTDSVDDSSLSSLGEDFVESPGAFVDR